MRFLAIILTLLVTLTSCDKRQEMLDKVIAAEKKMEHDTLSLIFDPLLVKAALASYQEFIDNFPKDSLTPLYIYKTGLIQYRNLSLHKEALENFELVESLN